VDNRKTDSEAKIENLFEYVYNLSPLVHILITLRSVEESLEGFGAAYEQLEVQPFTRAEFIDYFDKQFNREIDPKSVELVYDAYGINFEPTPYNINKCMVHLESHTVKTFENILAEVKNNRNIGPKFYHKLIRNCKKKDLWFVLYTLTLLDPDHIDMELLFDCLSNLTYKNVHKMLKYLGECFLVRLNGNKNHFLSMDRRVHDELVAFFKDERLASADKIKLHVLEVIVRRFASEPRFIEHAIVASKYEITGQDDEKNEFQSQLLEKLAVYYDRCESDSTKALDYNRRALDLKNRVEDGGSSPQAAVILNRMGMLCLSLTQWDRALDNFQHALDIFIAHYDEGWEASVAVVMSNIGEAYRMLGKFGKAVDYFEQASEVYEGLYKNADNLEVAQLLARKGAALKADKEFEKALQVFMRSLQMQKRIFKVNKINLYLTGDS
jgi:tetratricopeptide (TPR) repeat protein